MFQVVFLYLLSKESSRSVNQFRLNPYFFQVHVNEPFKFLDCKFLFLVEYLLERSMFCLFFHEGYLRVSHVHSSIDKCSLNFVIFTTGRSWCWWFFYSNSVSLTMMSFCKGNVVLGLDLNYFMFLKNTIRNQANLYKIVPLHLMECLVCFSLYLILPPHTVSEPSVSIGALDLTLKLPV